MTNICRCGTYNRVRAAIKSVVNNSKPKVVDANDIIHVVRSAT